MLIKAFNNMKGQSLLESVLALAAIAIVLSGIAVTVLSSLSNANYGKSQALATQYAQEGIEVLRKIRSHDYDAFRNYNGNYCLDKNARVLPPLPGSCSVPNVDSFIRSVNIEQAPGCGTNIAEATVKVSWTDGKCPNSTFCHASSIVSCLSTVNPIQAPFDGPPQAPQPVPTAGNTPIPTPTPTNPPPVNTTISFSLSPNPASTSQSITFSATVTGSGCVPTGAVYFYWDNQTANYTAGSTGSTNPGTATAGYPASAIGVGNHQAFARYVPQGSTCPGRDSVPINFVIQ